MLILSRHQGQSIMIGDNVVITVLGVYNGKVRVGINAPKEIGVHREEVFARIADEKHVKGAA